MYPYIIYKKGEVGIKHRLNTLHTFAGTFVLCSLHSRLNITRTPEAGFLSFVRLEKTVGTRKTRLQTYSRNLAWRTWHWKETKLWKKINLTEVRLHQTRVAQK